jgi:hypothetical protein
LTAGGVAADARGSVFAERTTSVATVQELLRQRADLPAGHPGHAVLRARSIEAGLPLARQLAARYQGRGEPLDDLYQVAALALVKAVDGYDPARQVAFTSYAVPTIIGGLKRHFGTPPGRAGAAAGQGTGRQPRPDQRQTRNSWAVHRL